MHPSTPQSHLKGLMTCCLLMGRAQRTAHAAWDKKHQINYNNNKLWTFFKLDPMELRECSLPYFKTW